MLRIWLNNTNTVWPSWPAVWSLLSCFFGASEKSTVVTRLRQRFLCGNGRESVRLCVFVQGGLCSSDLVKLVTLSSCSDDNETHTQTHTTHTHTHPWIEQGQFSTEETVPEKTSSSVWVTVSVKRHFSWVVLMLWARRTKFPPPPLYSTVGSSLRSEYEDWYCMPRYPTWFWMNWP